jgi:hypothetical protein
MSSGRNVHTHLTQVGERTGWPDVRGVHDALPAGCVREWLCSSPEPIRVPLMFMFAVLGQPAHERGQRARLAPGRA